MSVVDRDLKNARVKGLDDDWRFSIAYNAVLQAAIAALTAAGYSVPKGESNHFRAIASLRFTIGLEQDLLDKLDRYRRRRGMTVYDVAGVITTSEASDMQQVADEIYAKTVKWLKSSHPQLI